VKLKVLIVDDEAGIREVLKEYFESEYTDLEIDTAENANAALEKIENNVYHFILLDIVMPGMDPFDLLKKVKEMNKLIQVIIITGNSTLDKVLNALEFGADDYLTKPFDFDTLKSIIDTNIEKIIRWKTTFKNSL